MMTEMTAGALIEYLEDLRSDTRLRIAIPPAEYSIQSPTYASEDDVVYLTVNDLLGDIPALAAIRLRWANEANGWTSE